MSSEVHLLPIGRIINKKKLKFDAPYQPQKSDQEISLIELDAHHNYEQALADLDGFDYIWIIWWFHKAKAWKPKVRPPRGPEIKRGVFATRSPHRPNPIGITVVPLISVNGRYLQIGSNDLIDGTPILDIKPYLKEVDSFPDAKSGWVQEIEKEYNKPSLYNISVSDIVNEQIEWLKEKEINFIDRAKELLLKDPSPNRTRRIFEYDNNIYKMACGAWRLYFEIEKYDIKLLRIESGYPLELLNNKEYDSVPYREEQLLFRERFGIVFIE
jgi:tRNA-Thr(GGU) m(6)t(6)A37 methyltransferase TsaA